MNYHFSKILHTSFGEAVSKATEELKKEGFGIISEVDLKEKFKEKLDVDFREYKILGACNPKLAYQAIGKEPAIGVMLPCNVVVQEKAKNEVEVSAINPLASIGGVDNAELEAIASDVSARLKRAVDAM